MSSILVDAFSDYVTLLSAPKQNACNALFEYWIKGFGLTEEIRSDSG